MARRQRTTAFEALIGVVARLPWWACLLLAVVSYVVLRSLAAPAAAPVLTHPGQMGAVVFHSMWKGLAYVGQFLVPFACVIAAGISGYRQLWRQALVSGIAKSPAADALNGMSWRDFELLVGEGFRLQGYQMLETGGGGPDGGIDLVLKREGETFLVQCKQWRALKVGVSVVRELYGVMAARGAAGGFVVTSGSFTPEAEAFASGTNVKLIDGKKLLALIQQAKAAQLASKGGQRARVEPAVTAAPRTGASWSGRRCSGSRRRLSGRRRVPKKYIRRRDKRLPQWYRVAPCVITRWCCARRRRDRTRARRFGGAPNIPLAKARGREQGRVDELEKAVNASDKADNLLPDASQAQNCDERLEAKPLPTLDKAWLARMMRNMKRMAVDDNYRREVARQLS